MVDDARPRRGARARSSGASAMRCRPSRCRRSTPSPTTTSASATQRHDGLATVGVPVHVGLLGGERLVALADLARAARRRGADHAPAEPRRSPTSPAGEVDAVVAALARPRAPARRQRPARERDRLHGRAALQLLGDRDEDAARHARSSGLEERFGDDVARAAAAPRRLPARVRASTGSATSASRARPPATRRASAARPTTSTSAARLGPRAAIGRPRVPARADATSSTRPSHGLVGGWLDGTGPTARRLPAFLDRTTDDELGLPGRARAGAEPERGGGTREQRRELLDDLEAGELSVEFEGLEPWDVLEWAIERFGDGLALSTAFQDGDVALIDMALPDRPRGARVLDRHGPAAAGDARPRRGAARALPGAPARAPLARRAAAPAPRRPARAEPLPPLGRAAAALLQRPQGAAAEPRARRPRLLGDRASAATSGRRAPDIRKVEIDHDHDAIVQAQPARGVDARRGVGLPARERRPDPRALRARATRRSAARRARARSPPGEPTRAGRWWWETDAPKECGMHCSIETGGFEHELHAILGDEAHA